MKITMTIEADSATELQNTVLHLADFCSLSTPEINKPRPNTAVKKDPVFAAFDAAFGKEKPEAEAPKYTKEQVRDRLASLPKEKVKALWAEFEVKQLSDIPAEKYPELMAKAI